MKYSLKTTLVAYLIRATIQLLLWTCRLKILGGHHLRHAASQGSCIVSLWHNQLILLAPSLLGAAPQLVYTAFISNSKDGDFAAAYATSHSNGRTIRVPHNAKGDALRELIKHLHLKDTVAVITPDGPRGPRYIAKQGIAISSKETGAVIVPFSWTSTKYWELKSWDGFRIPKPFSTIEATFTEPLQVDSNDSLEQHLAKIQKSMSARI